MIREHNLIYTSRNSLRLFNLLFHPNVLFDLHQQKFFKAIQHILLVEMYSYLHQQKFFKAIQRGVIRHVYCNLHQQKFFKAIQPFMIREHNLIYTSRNSLRLFNIIFRAQGLSYLHQQKFFKAIQHCCLSPIVKSTLVEIL